MCSYFEQKGSNGNPTEKKVILKREIFQRDEKR